MRDLPPLPPPPGLPPHHVHPVMTPQSLFFGSQHRSNSGIGSHHPYRTMGAHYGFAPTKHLSEKLRARDWDAARSRVLSHPWDACFRAKKQQGGNKKNNATPLHLACLYRAPYDLVEWILNANPQALFCQDSEGWTPLHVIVLYGNNDKTALLLIRRGGAAAAAIQSKVVGAPLHLACRHGCSTTVIQELLRANPDMATTANEYSTKPASILWHQYSRNPENEEILLDILSSINAEQTREENTQKQDVNTRDLIERLALLLRAAKGKQPMSKSGVSNLEPDILHDVVMSTDDTVGDLSHVVALIVRAFPGYVRSTDEMGDLPLHKAASRVRSTRSDIKSNTNFHLRRIDPTGRLYRPDPVEYLIRNYPAAARIPNRRGLLPLHIALSKGKRTWRTGVSTMVQAAPEVLMTKDTETDLLPFQLAAATATMDDADFDKNNDDETATSQLVEGELNSELVETVMELVLACPHAMDASSQ